MPKGPKNSANVHAAGKGGRAEEVLCRRRTPTTWWLALLIGTLFAVSEAEAGPWTFKRNAGRVETYLQHWENQNTFDASGESRRNPNNGRYSEWLTEMKLEYGLLDRLNLLLSIPHKSAGYGDWNNTWSEDGLSDMRLALKWRFPVDEEPVFPLPTWLRRVTNGNLGCCHRGCCCESRRCESDDSPVTGQPWVFAVQVGTKIPLGYDEAATPPLGNGHSDIEGLFLLGRSFKVWDRYGFVSAEFGYRVRNGEHTDAVPFRLEGAIPLPYTRGLLVKASFDGIEGIQATDGLDEDYANGVIGLLWEAERVDAVERVGKGWFLEAGYGNTLAGKNSGNGQFAFLKVAFQF